MEAKDILFFGLLGLGAYYIFKSGYKPEMVKTKEGFKIIPIMPSAGMIESKKEPQPQITYNISLPQPQPISFPKIVPEEPKKVIKIKGKTGTWTYEPQTGFLFSPKGEGYSTAYPEQTIKSIEEAQKYPTKKEKKKEYITFKGVKISKEAFLKRPEFFGGKEAVEYAEKIKKEEKAIRELFYPSSIFK